MIRLDQAIARMASKLAGAGFETARLDARLLACHGLGLNECDLIVQFDRVLSESEEDQLDGCLQRRLSHEPMAHILGVREFWGCPSR